MSKSIVVIILLLACLGTALHGGAQTGKVRGSVKGVLVDSSGKQNLGDATVSLTPDADTTNPEFMVTDRHGTFHFNDLRPGSYQLLITFEGYLHISRRFTVSADHKDYDLSNMYMQRAADMLPDVVIQSPPIAIHKDTV